MQTSQDVDALCAAVNAGDDSALVPLADALEEAGDKRAEGVRQIRRRGRFPERMKLSVFQWGWRFGDGHAFCVREAEAVALDKLPGAMIRWGDWRLYDTRAEAYLALAGVG